MSIGATTTSAPGKIYDVSFFQIFQGDLIRGYGGLDTPQEGRRVLATQLHDAMIYNPKIPNSPTGSTFIASDGSLAAFVPARRALTWQLTDETGKPVVRERLWLTFKAGEVRLCKSCHGITSTSQNGEDEPTNSPEALRYLLQYMKTNGDAPLPTFAPTPNIPTLTPTPYSSNITYKLAIKRTKQSQKKSSYKLTITRNVPQDSSTLSLKLKINKISCSQSLPVNFQGLTKSISFSALYTSKKQKLVLELLKDSKSEKTLKISISNTQKKKRTLEQLCKNVFK